MYSIKQKKRGYNSDAGTRKGRDVYPSNQHKDNNNYNAKNVSFIPI